MHYQHLPPLNAVRAFDAAVRHGSISEAARRLCVSQSAVSRHIGNLEDFLNCALLNRSKNGVTLTDDGREFHEQSGNALLQVLDVSSRIRARQSGIQVLRINSLSSFALRWLVPRLVSFQSAYPGIAIDLSISEQRPDFENGASDGAIVSEQMQHGVNKDHCLFEEELVVVCAPSLLANGELRIPRQIVDHPIIHTSSRAELWVDWCSRFDVLEPPQLPGSLAFQDFYISIAAAIAGSGVALVPSFLVREELASGVLVQPLAAAMLTGRVYRIVAPMPSRLEPAACEFFNWLYDQTVTERSGGENSASDFSARKRFGLADGIPA